MDPEFLNSYIFITCKERQTHLRTTNYSKIWITTITASQKFSSSYRYVCSWHCHCHTSINVYEYCKKKEPKTAVRLQHKPINYRSNVSAWRLACKQESYSVPSSCGRLLILGVWVVINGTYEWTVRLRLSSFYYRNALSLKETLFGPFRIGALLFVCIVCNISHTILQ